MTGPTPRRLKRFAQRHLRLARYLKCPGDGRQRPQIPAEHLVWAQLIGQVLREWAFHAIQALVRSAGRRALGVARGFGDDALAYFTERLDPGPTRRALVQAVRRAKRNKAFAGSRFIGLALDGTGAGGSERARCALCQPILDATRTVSGHLHHLSLISVVGTGLTLPLDVEPYGPADSEYAASQRLLTRVVFATMLGIMFSSYLGVYILVIMSCYLFSPLFVKAPRPLV